MVARVTYGWVAVCGLRDWQVVEDGYEFFAKRQLVTLFSAPNYCGEFDNAGAMMSVDETLMCSFQVTWLSLYGQARSQPSDNGGGVVFLGIWTFFGVWMSFQWQSGENLDF